MDLNTSELYASLFFGDVHNTASTSTPAHKNTGATETIVPTVTTEIRKRKLIQTPDVSELAAKQTRLSNSFKIIAEQECIPTDSDIKLVENNVSVITIDDDTIKFEKTLIGSDSQDALAIEVTNDKPQTGEEAIKGEESRTSSRYETISETCCSDVSELSDVSSIPLDSSDDSVKFPKFTEENDSVVFVRETFPSNLQTCRPTGGAKRMIIVDGSNVAFAHSSHRKEFSVEGIRICIDYFIEKDYDVKAVVPQMRLKRSNSTNYELLEQLKNEGKVIISPCKSLPNGRSIISYDDRFILDLAQKFDGVVISNDNFRDLFHENDDYKTIIQNRIIGYMFCNDVILFPKDPYGRNGQTLDEILSKKIL